MSGEWDGLFHTPSIPNLGTQSYSLNMVKPEYMTIGFIFTPINAASMMLLPPDKVRMGAGLINIMQQGIGGTVGLAMMTTMLERHTAYHASRAFRKSMSS
jgi:hypothetical protein